MAAWAYTANRGSPGATRNRNPFVTFGQADARRRPVRDTRSGQYQFFASACAQAPHGVPYRPAM